MKEPHVRFPVTEGEDPPKNQIQIVKTGNDILSFDFAVNDDGGCWLYFEKLPAAEEEVDPKKKAPAKGKA